MSRYAEGTSVPIAKTQIDLEKLLADYGADQFARGWSEDGVIVGFRIGGRQVRMQIPMPIASEERFTKTPTGKRRTAIQARDQYDAEARRRWRSLYAVVKAKLVAVEDGISTIEREFFADLLLPDGHTLHEWAAPQIESWYERNEMPALLPGVDS